MARSSSYRLGWANLYRSGRVVYVPPPPRRADIGEQAEEMSERAMVGRRETCRGMSLKSQGVYAVITDFSLQLQRSEKTGTELGKPWTVSAPVPALLDRRGRAHTKWRDRPTAWEAVRTVLAPVPAELGRGCARASAA